MLKDLNLVGGMTNTDWLNHFHDEMRTHKIPQGQLAKNADYSRSHLNQMLTGNKPINQQPRRHRHSLRHPVTNLVIPRILKKMSQRFLKRS